MKKLLLIVLSSLLLFGLFACGNKAEIDEIKGMETYQDPAVKFELQYPSNWIMRTVPSARFLCFSNQNVKSRFLKYDPLGASGAKIEVLITKLDSLVTMDTVIDNKLFQKNIYSKPEETMVDGVNAIKQTYEFQLNDGVFHGEVYYATKDNKLATTVLFEAFSDTYKSYKKTFDDIVSSMKLAVEPEAKADTIFETTEAEPPSKTLRTMNGNGFSIGIPDNFSKERGMYMGKRRGDSYIKVDAFDAAKTKDLAKLVNENKKKLSGASNPQSLTISGEKAMKLAYKPSSNVAGEMYFILKNKKLYRITLNWFKGEAKDFKPVFQKCAMTFKIK